MNYRHAFHAGNHADVLKHATLTRVLQHMLEKPKPFMFLDTHAGIGRYDLEARPARRTGEADDGIRRLWDLPRVPGSLKTYLAMVRKLNHEGGLRWYPGSPAIARLLLRPEDRIELCELHPQDAQSLKRATAGDKRVNVRRENGYHALRSALPPAERRGVILVDPPYEIPDEVEQMARGFAQAYRRFATGTYLFWYPIKDRGPVDILHAALAETGARRQLACELCLRAPDSAETLNGSGLVIVNPPFGLDTWLAELLPILSATFNAKEHSVRWLVPE